MYTKALSSIILVLFATEVVALDFYSSNWIWTDEAQPFFNDLNVPAGTRDFRRDFTSPQGKSALTANIIIAADNIYTLYINGAPVGTGNDWQTAGTYCIPLAASRNVFAVNVTNLPLPNPGAISNNYAGLLAAIEITYADYSTDTIVSDASWLYSISTPSGFEQPGYDDSAWPPAVVEGMYGISPWGIISIPAPWTPLSLSDSNWIWTNEVSQGSAPAGSRAFRKVLTLPPGQTATSATIYISADDEYTFYVQGVLVGAGTTWQSAQMYNVDITPAAQSEVVVAVEATNTAAGPAGLIAAVQLTLGNCTCDCVATFVTDGTWKYSTTVPNGFQAPGFSDSTWPNAIGEGLYGVAPWGNIPLTYPSPF